MARATGKTSTSSRSCDLTDRYHEHRIDGATHAQALRRLADLLLSEEVEISPPLPPAWRFAFGPLGELYLTTPDGVPCAPRRVVFKPRTFPDVLKPMPPSPGVLAAWDSMYPESAPTPEDTTPAPEVKRSKRKRTKDTTLQDWLDKAIEANPKPSSQRVGLYHDDLHGRMEAAVKAGELPRAWSRESLGRRAYRKKSAPDPQP